MFLDDPRAELCGRLNRPPQLLGVSAIIVPVILDTPDRDHAGERGRDLLDTELDRRRCVRSQKPDKQAIYSAGPLSRSPNLATCNCNYSDHFGEAQDETSRSSHSQWTGRASWVWTACQTASAGARLSAGWRKREGLSPLCRCEQRHALAHVISGALASHHHPAGPKNSAPRDKRGYLSTYYWRLTRG